MQTVTVSEFNEEMDRIEVMQNRVAEILKSNWLVKWWNFGKATQLHNEAEKAMLLVWVKAGVNVSNGYPYVVFGYKPK